MNDIELEAGTLEAETGGGTWSTRVKNQHDRSQPIRRWVAEN